jgi:hypothetical protein
VSPNKYPGVVFIAAAFILAWGVIGATTGFGSPANSLHASAQSWAFVVVLGILAGYGLSGITELWARK